MSNVIEEQQTPWYKIPHDLAQSIWDHELVLKLFGAGGSVRVAFKVLAFYGVGIIFILWIMSFTWVKHSGLWSIPVFLWLLTALIYFGRTHKTKELVARRVMALVEYLPTSSRKVATRRTSKPYGLYRIVGIDSIDKDGLVHFIDGDVGRYFAVEGSASHLMFVADQIRILNRVDYFWRSWFTHSEISQITLSEPQEVDAQIANMKRQEQALIVRHPELLDLMEEKFEIQNNYVGRKLMSFRQYYLVRSPNEVLLNQAVGNLVAEARTSSLIFKSLQSMPYEPTVGMLSKVYQGRTRPR